MDGDLIKDPSQSLLHFAIKEYTGGRFYQAMNKVLSKREYLKVSNYICSILRGLPEVQHLAYKETKKPLFRGIGKDYVNLDQY